MLRLGRGERSECGDVVAGALLFALRSVATCWVFDQHRGGDHGTYQGTDRGQQSRLFRAACDRVFTASAKGRVEIPGTSPPGGKIVVWVAEYGTQVLPVDMAVVREVDSDHVLELESRAPAACVSSVMHVSAYSKYGAVQAARVSRLPRRQADPCGQGTGCWSR